VTNFCNTQKKDRGEENMTLRMGVWRKEEQGRKREENEKGEIRPRQKLRPLRPWGDLKLKKRLNSQFG